MCTGAGDRTQGSPLRRRADRATVDRVAAFIRDGRATHRFASTDAFLVALDAEFLDLHFIDFVAGYFLANMTRNDRVLQ